MTTPETTPSAWHEEISTALEVERLEVDLFRSKTLWLPMRARGVFGGQVISQALVSATNTVDPKYGLHSLHCYFLLSASVSTPIVYLVERIRDGRSYVTRNVKALQNGRVVFMMICSFHKPEPWQPNVEWSMPIVPKPDACELEEHRFSALLNQENLHPRVAQIYREVISERTRSPIAIKSAVEADASIKGMVRYMYWMKARDALPWDAPFQKCILSYLSDLYLLLVVSRTSGLKRFGTGPDSTSMTSTISHSISFFDDSFHCGDWLLYVMTCPRAASGRGAVYGQVYTESGTLVAVTTQEGVIRADRQGPQEAKL